MDNLTNSIDALALALALAITAPTDADSDKAMTLADRIAVGMSAEAVDTAKARATALIESGAL